MKPIDINDVEEFEPVELFGKLCLLSYKRIADASVPEGLFKYDLRHGDDWGIPCEVCTEVVCNYFGTILTDEEIPVDFTTNTLSIKQSDDRYDFDPIESQGLEDDEIENMPYDIESYTTYDDTGKYDIPDDCVDKINIFD